MSNHLFCFKISPWLNASSFRQEIHYLKNYPFGSLSSSMTWPTDISKSLKLKRLFNPLEPYLFLAYTIEFLHLKKYLNFVLLCLKKFVFIGGKNWYQRDELNCLKVIEIFTSLILEKRLAKIRSWKFSFREFLIVLVCGIIVSELDHQFFLYH